MRTWLLITIVAAGACLDPGFSSASILDSNCRGAMGNRDIYTKVERVCEDCTNLYRLPQLDGLCRNRCFNNQWFLLCLKATERQDELENFRLWISILNAGRAW
ncbi:molt-inhibiting hormone-like [Penaeus japonicus]|uniref:Molt-inhibiting hormone C n=1 Tax=Penaeus japonicus TaxID=27405 RepID=Q2MGW1_PENJP|nr:molt-inhibiting hormone-like [Penaeus japonicus]BAE78494.1 molt-inhibiting hormone C [Penaeus japonicus]